MEVGILVDFFLGNIFAVEITQLRMGMLISNRIEVNEYGLWKKM